jgi:AcrR family transcriptional regulator
MQIASKAARSGRPRSFDEGLALEKAMIVFWQKGYDDASITDLVKAMGITPPSLYAAFGNKQSLFLRTLQHYAEGPSSYALKALDALTARQVAEQRLYATIEARCDSAWPPGCLATQTAARWGGGKSAIGQAILANGARLHKAYVERFERAKAEGDLPQAADPEALARYLDVVGQGLSIQATCGATREELRSVADIALQQWPAW